MAAPRFEPCTAQREGPGKRVFLDPGDAPAGARLRSPAAMPRGKKAGGPKTYVALLRGINLGARNKVSMSDLRALFESLGTEDVETYVQSGNVVFRSDDDPAMLTDAIQKRISSDLGLSVTVLVRT